MFPAIIDEPTERTTAATDLIVAVVAAIALVDMLRIGQTQPWKARLWAWMFGLLVLAAVLGAVAHGFKLREQTKRWLWRPLFLSLGLLIALFVVATVYDLWGKAAAQFTLPIMLGVGCLFFAITEIRADSFLGFVLYQSVALVFSLAGYIWLVLVGTSAGAEWIAAGIFVTMLAAIIQAVGRARITIIWQFDHNGVYHLIQLGGIFLLWWGVRVSFLG